jgi:hypothetical protein
MASDSRQALVILVKHRAGRAGRNITNDCDPRVAVAEIFGEHGKTQAPSSLRRIEDGLESGVPEEATEQLTRGRYPEPLRLSPPVAGRRKHSPQQLMRCPNERFRRQPDAAREFLGIRSHLKPSNDRGKGRQAVTRSQIKHLLERALKCEGGERGLAPEGQLLQ